MSYPVNNGRDPRGQGPAGPAPPRPGRPATAARPAPKIPDARGARRACCGQRRAGPRAIFHTPRVIFRNFDVVQKPACDSPRVIFLHGV